MSFDRKFSFRFSNRDRTRLFKLADQGRKCPSAIVRGLIREASSPMGSVHGEPVRKLRADMSTRRNRVNR
jgi:hypothetical protein